MIKYLSNQNVQIVERVSDWKEAIRICIHPLVTQGYVHENYHQAIIENTLRWGAYYALTPYLVLPHARPEQGVITTQISLLLLKQPVYFYDQKLPIRLLIILAAKDSKSHLEILKTLARVISNENTMKQILMCEHPQILYQILLHG